MFKAEEGNLDEVKNILNDKSIDLNATNRNGYTALTLATKSGFT